jgi:hypothetical protein
VLTAVAGNSLLARQSTHDILITWMHSNRFTNSWRHVTGQSPKRPCNLVRPFLPFVIPGSFSCLSSPQISNFTPNRVLVLLVRLQRRLVK